jgi:H+/Cl- antiporter ClcA
MWWPALGGLASASAAISSRARWASAMTSSATCCTTTWRQRGLALLAVKLVIWLIALGSGTSGGVLAPLLMLGAGLGALLGPMAAGRRAGPVAAGVHGRHAGRHDARAVMAVVFAFELTHDANALLPLLAAAAGAYGFTVLTMGRSILTEKIARRGHHIYREYGIDPLERHSVAEVMTHERSSRRRRRHHRRRAGHAFRRRAEAPRLPRHARRPAGRHARPRHPAAT